MDPHMAADGDELEDGEICDDETEERAPPPLLLLPPPPPPRRGHGYRPGRGAHPRAHKRHPRPRGGPPPPGSLPPPLPPPPDFPFPMPYGLHGPHHGPFPPGHRQQCGPSGPDRPPGASPPLPPPPEPRGEPSPRGSFWERSHGALGRFRHRVLLPNGGGRGGWNRGGRGGGGGGGGGNGRSLLPGRYGPAEIHDCPPRKQKPPGRTRTRKGPHGVPKPDSGGVVDESFEDLLSKYKQIQLELECIRKEENMALAPAAVAPEEEEEEEADPGADPGADPLEAAAATGPESGPENLTTTEMENLEKKVFQAFNIKPLRQKLPTPAQLDLLHRKGAEPGEGRGGPEMEEGQEAFQDETEDGCELCGEPVPAAEGEPELKSDQNHQQACACTRPSDPQASRVTTRSAAAAAERRRTRSTPGDQAQSPAGPPGPKPGPKAGSGPGKSPVAKRTSPVEPSCSGDPPNPVPGGAGGTGTEAERRSEDCSEEAEQPGESSTSSEDSSPADRPLVKVEEEELSELQLRLLALQSASKKWQQKEQQVMRRSKDRISKATQDRGSAPGAGFGAPPPPPTTPSRSRVTTRSASSGAADRNRTKSRDRTKSAARPPDRDRDRPKPGPKGGAAAERSRALGKSHLAKVISGSHHQATGSVVKQAVRKQQLRTWKLQQQQEEKRRQEEEERRKREEEIRRIRDLSNQDEQYNRFMKLVGGHRRPRSRSRDGDHRKSSVRGGLDSSGNLYQYDNYEEVAMDTDSETGSPVPSPTRMLTVDEQGHAPYRVDFYPSFLPPLLAGGPPPPPPLPPPPPDELDPPPKPPFADEEEEEEMLLRETCLMSMAHKRVAPPETSSGPPSPGGSAPPSDPQQPPRGNLSTVSLNTVAPAQRKFPRGHPAGRAPLVLPRHKAVVVSLVDSDDSDSEGDACGSSPAVFGGLEFMIKEARRTVEAAKPKAASGCEKENNPVRSAEVAPEARKLQEIGREKPRTPRDSALASAPPAEAQTLVDSTLRAAAELKVAEIQQRLVAYRDVLQEDEAVLRQLLQQVLKKSESLKASEAKVSKLREQLQASEKVANANRTLLRKLQEQVRRVEQRVSLKRSVVLRLENDVLDAQQNVERGTKRKADGVQPVQKKLQRLAPPSGRSERHLAELMAHKRRLQQLESQYALKIQRLKAAQALRNRGGVAEQTPPPPLLPAAPETASPPPPPLGPPPPPPAAAPPQPSLHDLTQDKLVLDSEDVAEAEDAESALAPERHSPRRRSSGSFTRPHLDAPSSAPAKEGAGAKAGQQQPAAETWAGLDVDVDALRRMHQQRAPLGDLLLAELLKMQRKEATPPAGQVVPLELEAAASQSASSELRPAPFGAYHSPLLRFKSYRFSPYYRTKEKLSLSSVTFSNAVEVNRRFCRFDLTGTCNHDGCSWQHMRDVSLTGNQLFEDILSYSLNLIGCSEKSSDDDISAATESYMKKLFGLNRDRMGLDQKAVLLVSKVNESRRHVPPFTTCKDPRRWRPRSGAAASAVPKDDDGDEAAGATPGRAVEDHLGASVLRDSVDACVTSEDRRYFLSETDDVCNLESSVADSPGDTQLWIKLAFKYLNQGHSSGEENLEAALNTLSRALENNSEDPEVWTHYLTLFSKRGNREEVQEMCEMAVEHAADHRVWWKYLTLEASFEGKDSVCERLLTFLMTESSPDASPRLSFHLMEALLYRVELSVFSGREENAVGLLQGALESHRQVGVAARLDPSDRAVLWLSYIHLLEFRRLPSDLFDPAESGPSRLLRRRSFLLPWRTPEDVRTPLDTLLALFRDAVGRCSEDGASDRETIQACMPLHLNLIRLYRLLGRFEEAVCHCEALLSVCPHLCTVRGALADLHVCSGAAERAVEAWLQATRECPHDAEVFYHCVRFLMAQVCVYSVPSLFREFVSSLCEDQHNQDDTTDVLRLLLSLSSSSCSSSSRGSAIKKEAQQRLRHQTSFLHLLHCRWRMLTSPVDQAVDAFELALGSALQLEELHTLWMDYLLFTCGPRARRDAAGSAHSRTACELLQRCLSTVPSRLCAPFSPTHFYSCYTFHNQVVTLYLSLLPQSQHALLLERLHSAMPNNTELGLRLLLQLSEDGLLEQLRFHARLLSSSSPRCLALWKILLAVQVELKQQSEVRVVYQQALQHLPLCADLWKHRLLFEAVVGGGASERLRRLLESCAEAGVSVRLSGGWD
ncbi:unnamed protein product [Ophioblennius macclurei]